MRSKGKDLNKKDLKCDIRNKHVPAILSYLKKRTWKDKNTDISSSEETPKKEARTLEREREREKGKICLRKTISTDRIKISNGRLSKMAFRSFIRLEGLIRELLDDEPRDVPFKVSGIRLSKKKPRGIKWRCSFLLSLSRSSSCIFQS